jgi:hypothetical protein
MHRFTEQANFLAWNNDLDAAIEQLEPIANKNPNAAVELCIMTLTRNISMKQLQ